MSKETKLSSTPNIEFWYGLLAAVVKKQENEEFTLTRTDLEAIAGMTVLVRELDNDTLKIVLEK